MHSQLLQNLRVQDLMVSSLLALVVAWLGILMLNNHKPVTHPGTAAADAERLDLSGPSSGCALSTDGSPCRIRCAERDAVPCWR